MRFQLEQLYISLIYRWVQNDKKRIFIKMFLKYLHEENTLQFTTLYFGVNRIIIKHKQLILTTNMFAEPQIKYFL